jgi:hypothetical protein
MPYMILIPAHGLDKIISHLGVCHYITKTHLGGQDTLHSICRRSNPCGDCSPLPFIDSRGGAQGERKYKVQCLVVGMSRHASLSVKTH